MSHIDPDVLALLALGEDAAGHAERDHLAECAECRGELAELQRTAVVGRSTVAAGDLLEPHPRVWDAITRELADVEQAPVEQVPVAPASVVSAPVVPLRRRRWWPVAAAAAAVVLVGGGGVTWWMLRPAPPTVLASATLDPFPTWEGSSGEAVVEERGDGSRVIDVSLVAPADPDGFREAWLIDADGEQLVSLGVVDGDRGSFVIPVGLDLTRYSLVDVSEEPFDGDPSHSGDSIVRGELTAGS